MVPKSALTNREKRDSKRAPIWGPSKLDITYGEIWRICLRRGVDRSGRLVLDDGREDRVGRVAVGGTAGRHLDGATACVRIDGELLVDQVRDLELDLVVR